MPSPKVHIIMTVGQGFPDDDLCIRIGWHSYYPTKLKLLDPIHDDIEREKIPCVEQDVNKASQIP